MRTNPAGFSGRKNRSPGRTRLSDKRKTPLSIMSVHNFVWMMSTPGPMMYPVFQPETRVNKCINDNAFILIIKIK